MSAAKLHLVEEKQVPSPKAKSLKPRAKAAPNPKPEIASKVKDGAPRKSASAAPKAKKRDAVASDVMSSPALSCSHHATLNDAVRLMWEHDVGVIVIVDEHNRPMGMLTDRDACMAAYTQGIPLFHGSVGSAMSKSIISCTHSCSVSELREMMVEAQVRRLPVVDDDGVLVGLVGISDLMVEANGLLPKDRKRGSTAPMMMNLVDAILQKTAI